MKSEKSPSISSINFLAVWLLNKPFASAEFAVAYGDKQAHDET